MFNAWGGIQVHLFEQTIRDWLYIVYEKANTLNQEQIYAYLKPKYPCKPDYELIYIAEMLYNSIAFSPTLDNFVQEFLSFLYCFIPEDNIFLTQDEVFRLWTSDYLKNRIVNAAEKWRSRINTSG